MKLATLTLLAMATDCIYASAASKMATAMNMKSNWHKQKQDAGLFAEEQYEAKGSVECKDGRAGEYGCKNVNLKGSMSHGDMGSETREGNDIWGWTSADGREFALVGHTDGTGFVELINSGSELKYRGRLPTQTENEIWRDIKVIGHHAYISSEAKGHGMQVFDLHKLLEINGDAQPRVFDINSDLTAHFADVGSAHNVIANPDTNTIFLSGGDEAKCDNLEKGLMIINVKDPAHPVLDGCFGEGGYVHDARCVTYHGPDAQFQGREICLSFNVEAFFVFDVTDHKNPTIISQNPYDGVAYSHQGWELDSEWRFMLMDDEQDEITRKNNGESDLKTRTYIWDISSLSKPVNTGVYKSPVEAIDHNLYIKNHTAYMSNYGSGLRVVDASSIPSDPTGAGMRELAFFDCWPGDDEAPEIEFYGAWSAYIWFKSGTIIMNCIEGGLFALDVRI
ncbi:hypothetical protein E4U31_000880 [Claviceps sp. LM219 group G6]|nr:hypothetical protein E4U31_000880 [Claviceps sp. LM219 group G6]KAG6113177.1 hypothetical protein E4U14_001799 [Claviceps sp. LM454 group G7]